MGIVACPSLCRFVSIEDDCMKNCIHHKSVSYGIIHGGGFKNCDECWFYPKRPDDESKWLKESGDYDPIAVLRRGYYK